MKKLSFALSVLAAGAMFAETTPVMVSLVTPVQAPDRQCDVEGFRLSLIYGECGKFTGLEIGIVDNTRDDFAGLSIGGANLVGERMLGGQVGLVNWTAGAADTWERRSIGAQVGILNYAKSFCGLQDGVVNISEDYFAGLETGLLNCANDLHGVQCGYYFLVALNIASGNVRGCQIGLVNYADTMEGGVQIGLVNIISNNGWMPVFPIVNGSF